MGVKCCADMFRLIAAPALATVVLALLSAGVLAAFSQEEGRSASEKLERISNDELIPGEEVILSDEEINSFLHYEYAEELPDGVRGLRVRFEPNIGVVTGHVDFAKLSEGGDGPGMFLMMLLRGERHVEAHVRYAASNGMATTDITSFKVNGREMKGKLLDWLVDRFVAPNFDGFRLGEPTPLGHDLEEVRLVRGVALIRAREAVAAD